VAPGTPALAENISNANTPNFKPRDLVEPKFDNKGTGTTVGGTMGSLAMMRTSSSHIGVSGGAQSFNGEAARAAS
jgi:flagellar basal-body rod protein FlgB